ncbi:MAG: PAS domain S-box protein [Syntrophomonas sp.]
MSDDIFSMAFRLAPVPISINTWEEGRFIKINAAFTKTLGYELHELVEMNDPGLVWAIPEQFYMTRKELEEKGNLRDFEAKLRCKSGTIKTILLSAEIIEIGSKAYVMLVGRDITERKHMEEQLQAERNFNAAILDTTSHLIVVYDRKGRIVRFNRACEEVSGYSSKLTEGTLVWDYLLAPEDVGLAQEWFEQLNVNWGTLDLQQNHENYWVTRDGERRLISWSNSFLVDENNAAAYIISTGNDITRQRATEERLFESEAQLRVIYENAHGIIYTLTAEGKFIYVSQGWTEIIGHDVKEVEGRSFETFVHDEDIPFCRNFLEEVMTSGEPRKGVEYRVKHKDGYWRWHTSSAAAVKDEAGKSLYYVGLAVDITERKQAEEALQISEEKFSKAFCSSPTPLSITSLDDGRFIAVNDSFSRVVGCDADMILGRTSLELNMWFDQADAILVKNKIINKEPVRDFEIFFRKASGERRWGSYSAEVIDINGEKCLLTILTDITDRKRAEEEIKYLSFHDKLTDLYNRAYFEEELKRVDTGRQLPISIIMGDVNGLKLINDALGHQEGDRLLKEVAGILKKSCRQEDIVARWGGDEFIILLPGSDHNIAAKIMKRIRNACKDAKELPIDISISLGLAVKNTGSQNIGKIIKDAEDKMYRNKLLAGKSVRSSFLNSLEKTLWTRSHETEEHCRRMQEMALKLGYVIELPDSECDNLKLLAALHDIGKIAISSDILEKPGKLSRQEWENIKKHPEIGYRIALSSPEMAPIAEAILHHHERWDGSGYPLGVKGGKIPLLSRMISIIDAYDVMVNGRPYQKAISPEEAWAEIERCAGLQFDPELVEKAIKVFK